MGGLDVPSRDIWHSCVVSLSGLRKNAPQAPIQTRRRRFLISMQDANSSKLTSTANPMNSINIISFWAGSNVEPWGQRLSAGVLLKIPERWRPVSCIADGRQHAEVSGQCVCANVPGSHAVLVFDPWGQKCPLGQSSRNDVFGQVYPASQMFSNTSIEAPRSGQYKTCERQYT